mmetsp:Transcript_67483/g.150652  ORF Transcript_67483/g.150652 Transcript_67483/m.150652 type:complete len:235 (+) Transcript_67483:511-1215(+)
MRCIRRCWYRAPDAAASANPSPSPVFDRPEVCEFAARSRCCCCATDCMDWPPCAARSALASCFIWISIIMFASGFIIPGPLGRPPTAFPTLALAEAAACLRFSASSSRTLSSSAFRSASTNVDMGESRSSTEAFGFSPSHAASSFSLASREFIWSVSWDMRLSFFAQKTFSLFISGSLSFLLDSKSATTCLNDWPSLLSSPFLSGSGIDLASPRDASCSFRSSRVCVPVNSLAR